MSKFLRQFLLSVLSIILFAPTSATAETLGKLFIKVAPLAEGEFADPGLDDSVKDLKKFAEPERRGSAFLVVSEESEADFLIIVVERKVVLRSPAGTVINDKTIFATLSVRDGDKWKPAIKLERGGGVGWLLAAKKLMRQAEDWVKEHPKK